MLHERAIKSKPNRRVAFGQRLASARIAGWCFLAIGLFIACVASHVISGVANTPPMPPLGTLDELTAYREQDERRPPRARLDRSDEVPDAQEMNARRVAVRSID